MNLQSQKSLHQLKGGGDAYAGEIINAKTIGIAIFISVVL